MGVDIHISLDNSDSVYTPAYFSSEQFKNRPSREFCNLICRKNVVDHEPELDQIGRLTNVDITPLYQLENYPDPEELNFRLQSARSEEQKNEILLWAEQSKAKMSGNITLVLNCVSQLIDKLNNIPNLAEQLEETDFDTLNAEYYFSDFKSDKGEGYIGNNFGQDLRNLKSFLEYAKSTGSKTVWVTYG